MEIDQPSGLSKPGDTHSPETPVSPVLWTIGHSTRPIEELVGLLQSHGIQLLVDVRTIPFSRRNPQFHQKTLAQSLREAGLQYRHMPELGGRRKTRQDSVNVGWRNAGFRGYADYMQTQKFWGGLEELVNIGQQSPSAVMCAEAVPWRCHRTLIADALVIRGWTVHHIISASSLKTHALTPFAKPDAGRLTYPSEASSESTLRLF
ncbi:DUF488 domain-containing protein [Candidatus Nitrospira allomarina]|jgi:uncharacterized protein (DUF488 family)|uniref:DUF488 domain-containing protein n=1 Tax=Candidatus Nitrospira allomarina TaxID=3020900 RepID=A0AA96GFK7_9BACT|nr:DUF488 domain-containing protein [Candidatus Nitrospira allomarina]WNM59165.1 DUF488 domain-containing protein [Candidatus Nitrospira allomarina]